MQIVAYSPPTAQPASEGGRLSRQNYQFLIGRWLDSPVARERYTRAALDMARELVSYANFDDQSPDRLRAWPSLSAFGLLHRSSAWRHGRALAGEVAGVPGILTRRRARDGEVITRSGDLVIRFQSIGPHDGRPYRGLPYIYTFDAPETFRLEDGGRRRRPRTKPDAPPALGGNGVAAVPAASAGFQARVIPGGAAASAGTNLHSEPIQGNLPPTALEPTWTAAPLEAEGLQAAFAEVCAVYPKQYALHEAWPAWVALKPTAALTHAIVLHVRQQCAPDGKWTACKAAAREAGKPDLYFVPKLTTFLERRDWTASARPPAAPALPVSVEPAAVAPSLLAPRVTSSRGGGFTRAADLVSSVELYGAPGAITEQRAHTGDTEPSPVPAAREQAAQARAAQAELRAQAQRERDAHGSALRETVRDLKGERAVIAQALRDNARKVAQADPVHLEPTGDLAAERATLQTQDRALRERIAAVTREIEALGFVVLK